MWSWGSPKTPKKGATLYPKEDVTKPSVEVERPKTAPEPEGKSMRKREVSVYNMVIGKPPIRARADEDLEDLRIRYVDVSDEDDDSESGGLDDEDPERPRKKKQAEKPDSLHTDDPSLLFDQDGVLAILMKRREEQLAASQAEAEEEKSEDAR